MDRRDFFKVVAQKGFEVAADPMSPKSQMLMGAAVATGVMAAPQLQAGIDTARKVMEPIDKITSTVENITGPTTRRVYEVVCNGHYEDSW